MKKYLLFIIMLIVSLFGLAQNHRYIETKQFQLKDCIYECKVSSAGMVDLYNIGNKWIDIPMMYKSGVLFESPENDGKLTIEFSEECLVMIKKCRDIIRKLFSKYGLKNDEFMITELYLFPKTGKVNEVKFSFHKHDSFGTIPIEEFRAIELELKKEIQFTPSAEGRKLNYIYYWWDQTP